MKHSIRTRFTLIFIGIMSFILFAMYGVNKYFLEDYYMSNKVEVLKGAYITIDRLLLAIQREGKSITDVIAEEFGKNIEDSRTVASFRELNDKSNINIVLIDSEGNEVIAASREGDFMADKLRYYLSRSKDEGSNGESDGTVGNGNEAGDGSGIEDNSIRFPFFYHLKNSFNNIGFSSGTAENGRLLSDPVFDPLENAEIIYQNDFYRIQRTFDRRSNTVYLESWGYFTDGGTEFLMSMPVSLIHDSVGITNKFLLIVGIIVLILGSAIVYITTGIITRPINRLAKISERMTALDFETKYEGNAKDEIGILGHSMNTMSDRLEKTIAELKTANNKLLQDIDEKNKIDAMRKDFIANVSHELKTPIALIQGYAEGLTEGMAEDAESRDYYCNVIVDEAVKMNTMVKQLTSLNNLEFGDDKTEFVRFDIVELIKSLLENQKLVIKKKEAKIELIAPEHAYVWADEFKIEEVITNYFTNALNHLDGEREIIISVREEKKPGEADEDDEVLHEKRIIRVSVFNTGENIPEEDLDKIWEKFYKVDKARTRAYGGSGIGLSIVKAIIESHNQTCSVKNKKNGVEFDFTLDADK